MFLKKLVMDGFKSFSDYSEITFVKGISAIVGPNGCGKSNIIDAIVWVIGEQKLKSLRANNMSDVIFKGTEDKKGLGRAEVRLTLVNDQNIMPIDYDEVEVSRVIFANGENEYYINKKRVRLKDIQELFFDTGIGKSAYSVMAQGKIDMVLSSKPEDRRYMIEEAAGITKYKVKREEALSRLKQANENIIRVKDIIKEVKSQYGHMSKQAEKAKMFTKFHDNEIKLEIELNLNRIMKQKSLLEELDTRFKKSSDDLKSVEQKRNNLRDGVEEQLQSLTETENEKIESQRTLYSLQKDIEVLISKNDMFKDQDKQFELEIISDSERVKLFDNNIRETEEEIKNITKNKKEIEEKIVNILKDKEFYSENIVKIDKEIMEAEGLIIDLKKRIKNSNIEVEEKRSEHKSIIDQLITKIDQSINIFDVNSEEVSNFKRDLSDNISSVLDDLPKKRAFIDDIIKGGHISTDSNKLLNLLGGLREELLSIEKRVSDINKDTQKYIQKTEGFLNDIFGANGLVPQKRTVEDRISELVESINSDSDEIEVQQEEILKKREKKDSFNKVLHELTINLTTMKEKSNSIDKDLKRINSIKENHESNKNELAEKIKYRKFKISEIHKEQKKIDVKLLKLDEKKDALEKQLTEIDKQIRNENVNISSRQKAIKDINDKWTNKKNDVEKMQIKITESTTTITNIYESFYENYSIDLKEYESKKAYASNRSYDVVRKELNEVKANKHSLGSVNLMAIEESKILKERYDLLLEQLDDLEQAKKDINEMIGKIIKVSEELFLKTFKQIKTNFHKIFRKLFDGGNAEISLTKPDNVLESGIDIIAHPPGQKTQNITLLSGGQRTMTAIAIMFAAFFVKPSPFCLLDEIDAALDEENIRRFINLLFEFRDTSQFMIITHNSRTISASDVMYGVTQEQRGISKIVSAKFAEKTI